MVPGLTVDTIDKPWRVVCSCENGKAGGALCTHDVKLSSTNPDSRPRVDPVDKLPDTPIVHCIHGRGLKAVRPTKFWTPPKMDNYMSVGSSEGREAEFSSLSSEDTGISSDRSHVSSQHQKQNLSSVTSSQSCSHSATTPQLPLCDSQSTLQTTPRVSREVIPVMAQARSGQVRGKFYSPRKYSFTSLSKSNSGAHHAIASVPEDSGSIAKSTSAATRNDRKLRNILNSTWQASRSSPLSSLGSDRGGGGGQAVPEFLLWKKKWSRKNDVRKQNHKSSSTRLSTIAISSQNSPSLDEGATPFKPSAPSSMSSSSNNPFTTHATPAQDHHVVPAFSGKGDGLSSSSAPYTFKGNSFSRPCCAGPSPPRSNGMMKLAQNNASSIYNSVGGSFFDVRMSRDSSSNIYQETTIGSQLPPEVSSNSNSTSGHFSSSSSEYRWPCSPLKKDQSSVQDFGSNSSSNNTNTHGQGPQQQQQQQKSEEKRNLRQQRRHATISADAVPKELDIECGYQHRNSKSQSSAISRQSLKYRSCSRGFGSPIMSSEKVQGGGGGNNSMMNEAMDVCVPRPIETQWKDHSTGFHGSNQNLFSHRRGGAGSSRPSSSSSKFQEVTSHSVVAEQRHRSRMSHSASLLLKSQCLENLSSCGGSASTSEPEEEMVTMRWKRGELLGEGRFGKVFLGLNEETGVLFAVKEIMLVDGTDDEVAVLQSEINTMKHLSHPNIVSYVGMECTDYSMFIFLEYVVGGSIAAILQQFGVFKEDLIRRFTQQIIRGVCYLHSYRIIHRDIKGGNVLVTGQGVAKLADFGCSKQLQGMQTQHSEDSSHVIRGSVPWMAPEVIKQTGHGRSADIWSVGATVIEMASASHPWPAFSNNLAFLFHVATASEPPPIPEVLSDDAQAFLKCCLCLNPEDRWKADELANHVFLLEDRKGGGSGGDPTML